ncbi:hypothetical protein Taro_006696 [Colocasia esculenta]|uniref:Uncharacterized protein n=1 Tax=Colocasia esculenta TaxID=4460 RepID=A0A843TYF3_COLES|nr:hypothetical protein [Colocasia esculenta]
MIGNSVRPLTSYPRPRSKPPCLVKVRQDTKYTIVTTIVWLDYGPTPGLSRWFRGHKERGSEKKDRLACIGKDSKRPRHPRPTTRALKMAQRRCPNHHFPLRSRVHDSSTPVARNTPSPGA